MCSNICRTLHDLLPPCSDDEQSICLIIFLITTAMNHITEDCDDDRNFSFWISTVKVQEVKVTRQTPRGNVKNNAS